MRCMHDCTVLDLTSVGKKQVLRYKIQKEKQASWADYKRAARVVLINQIVVAVPVSVAFYHLLHFQGWSLRRELPEYPGMRLAMVLHWWVDGTRSRLAPALCHWARACWRPVGPQHHHQCVVFVNPTPRHPPPHHRGVGTFACIFHH